MVCPSISTTPMHGLSMDHEQISDLISVLSTNIVEVPLANHTRRKRERFNLRIRQCPS